MTWVLGWSAILRNVFQMCCFRQVFYLPKKAITPGIFAGVWVNKIKSGIYINIKKLTIFPAVSIWAEKIFSGGTCIDLRESFPMITSLYQKPIYWPPLPIGRGSNKWNNRYFLFYFLNFLFLLGSKTPPLDNEAYLELLGEGY